MTSFRILLISAWMAIACLMAGCDESQQQGLDIIQIKGVAWACNVNTSYAVFGSSSESEENLEIFLPASEGDLIYMLLDDFQIYHRYSAASGTSYTASFDTLKAVSAYLNGHLSYQELTSPESLEAFMELSDAEMQQLSSLYIADVLTEDLISNLNERESLIQGIGLILENNSGSGRLQDLLSIVRPSFLVIDDSWTLPDPDRHISLSSLELLWVEGNIEALEKLARCCSNLESLIIADWEPVPGELLPLADLKKLKSLTIAESSLISLSSIEFPPSLQNLYLINCDTLSDIEALLEMKNLSSLNLTQCERINNPGLVMGLESLQRLSLPPGISHEEFRELPEHLQGLEVVELVDCPDILDLSPLKALPELRILQLQLERDQLSRLEDLNQLELLVLTSEIFEDNPSLVNELRATLPDTRIVPGSGICLGSGWFMLLLPLILLFRLFFRRKA